MKKEYYSKEELQKLFENRKPKTFQKSKKITVFKLDSDTLRKLAYNNNLNRLTWSRYKYYEKIQALGLTEYKYLKHRAEIEKQVVAYLNSLETKENIVTTGKTLGEVEEEMKETEEKCSETYVLSLIEAAKDEISQKDYEALKGFAKNVKEWSEATVSFVETQIENNKKLFLIWKH